MSHSQQPQQPAPPQPPVSVPEPRTADGRAGLAALLAAPRGALIGLDFDGTLSPIVPDPAAARAHPGAPAALRGLAPQVGTLAVITGRPALDAVRYGGLEQVPGIIVLGHYGRQRWQDGSLTSPPAPPGLAAARERLPDVLAAADAPEGTWVEEKGEAVAVHTRRAAQPQQALERLRAPLTELAERTGLVAEPGRLVIELRPPGSDKGQALKELVSARGASAVLFCGDDLGDRPAFHAVRELRAAGIAGVTVCSGSAEVAGLADEADLVVDGPDGVVGLLEYLRAVLARRAPG
ncbi:MAG TPA: trehalose-phosphatase [Streptosporangiaceae bacterium]|nr:trehalose-phosphatase [Streptosporangiaceae bacterium]